MSMSYQDAQIKGRHSLFEVIILAYVPSYTFTMEPLIMKCLQLQEKQFQEITALLVVETCGVREGHTQFQLQDKNKMDCNISQPSTII